LKIKKGNQQIKKTLVTQTISEEKSRDGTDSDGTYLQRGLTIAEWKEKKLKY